MADLKEVFDMVTKQSEPDQDSWKQQEQRQRKTSRNRRVSAIVLVAAIVAAAILVVVVSRPKDDNLVGGHPSGASSVPFVTTAPIGAQVIGLDGTPLQQLPGSFSGASGLALSPDGTTIAYVLSGDVFTVGIDGSGARSLTGGGNTNSGDGMFHVSWSPDGSKIAYGWSGNIWVMNADGSSKQRLTHSAPGTGSYYPAFSPDGSTIAYWSGTSTGEDGGPPDAEIYSIPATGGTPSRLTNDGQRNIEPGWSPGGTRIAFKHGEALGVMRADGSGLRDVSAGSVNHGPWAPAWSRDGTMIAFLVYDASERAIDGGPLLEVRILNLSTGIVQRLGVRVEADSNGAQWVNDSLLVNRYD